MSDYRPSCYALAWDALSVYRGEMRIFVVSRLKEAYGEKLWMAQGVEKNFKIEEIENLRRILGQRQRIGVVDTAAESMSDMLDVNHFRQIIEVNWGPVFKKALGDKAILDSWIAEVTASRNALAHWTSGEMPRKDALRVIDTCERVVRSINPESADKLLAIWDAVDAMGREGPTESRRATVVFEDGEGAQRATIIFDDALTPGPSPAGRGEEQGGKVEPSSMAKARADHPRAYEAWTKDEEAELMELSRSGHDMHAIAGKLGRQPSAIRSRLQRLGVSEGNPSPGGRGVSAQRRG